ncbi:Arrestin like protein [Eufriesea mexicana]|uniref:Arrestin like protein n=1 Tax=Eufriesea mexicana TaxID=516756 RepID=A0A310SUK8_9HYME|nr:Arrestin like protein [Eufriesea mexicana]
MAENERHAEPEVTVLPSDSVEHRVSLYPIKMESKRSVVETISEARETSKKETHTPENRAKRLQQTQSLPQMQPADTQTNRKVENPSDNLSDTISSQRVYKKSSPNNKLTLYLASRDLIVSEAKIDKLQGVLLLDPEFLQDKRVYGQITLTFRYGREDEEVMGLKFCNEAIMYLAQLYPPHSSADQQETTPLQVCTRIIQSSFRSCGRIHADQPYVSACTVVVNLEDPNDLTKVLAGEVVRKGVHKLVKFRPPCNAKRAGAYDQ